jgi:pyrroloquinoline quinone biosynthesis protein E
VVRQDRGAAPPVSLLAELTHRCPLSCAYCSNPLELAGRNAELDTAAWSRVFAEAAALGAVHLHLSGGEPLSRADLTELAAAAAESRLYTNLITSGLGLTARRAAALAEAGLNSVQLSIQGPDDALMTEIAGRGGVAAKRRAADAVHAAGLPLSMNVVLHARNLDRLEEIVGVARSWGARRLELANTQYYGWALRNREALMPTREQLAAAEAVYDRLKAELRGTLELLWIIPDYYEQRPKPCMGGWAAQGLTVAPDGRAMPCPVAADISTLTFPRVQDAPLEWIWYESPAFAAYRGTGWMPDPCRSCEHRFEDFGGCRCQAFALTGDAGRTDPVCGFSPDRGLIDAALATMAARPGIVPLTLREKAGAASSTLRSGV